MFFSRARRAADRKEKAEKATKESTENEENTSEEEASHNMENVELLNETEEVISFEILNETEQVVNVTRKDVNDELCPDALYLNAENIGKEAFRCLQCRMMFLPTSHLEGNRIKNFDLCRMHIGVHKCENCAHVLVGLARLRCHRQVCQNSA